MWKEFKEFAVKGNVVDLAVAVIIGAAFGKIVTSFVEDVIMPPIGAATGGLDFSNLYMPLSSKITPGLALADAKKLGPVLAYGNFITIVINFIIVAFCIFLVVKALNNMKRPKTDAAPVAKECPYCTKSIPIKASRCPECTAELMSGSTAALRA
ncbi:MAG: large conductance mechanosensitive channel protein MscL [Chthoniobacterales bacterium]